MRLQRDTDGWYIATQGLWYGYAPTRLGAIWDCVKAVLCVAESYHRHRDSWRRFWHETFTDFGR